MAEPLPGLDAFLTALRFEGFPVGSHEIARLHHVFRQSPLLDRGQLHALLACTLVKHPDQQERFDALFEDWYALADGALELPATAPQTEAEPELAPPPSADTTPMPSERADISPPPDTPVVPNPAPQTLSWGIWVVVLGTLLILSLGYGLWQLNQPPDMRIVDETPEPPAWGVLIPNVPQMANHYRTWEPEIEAIDVPPYHPVWLALALALTLLSLTSGVFLGWRYYRRQDIPPFDPPPKPGPSWLPLPEPEAIGSQMLHRDELRQAVWRVERFVSEDLTSMLDVDRTVEATATAGGWTEIYFQPAIYAREVWLWRDEMIQDVAVERLLSDIERSLTRAGLPVRCGSFTDTPGWVRWQDGQGFSPLALEGHRQSALVVIITDGYGMQLASDSALEHAALDNLLRAFGEWPRLAFVDASGDDYGLAARVQALGLTCIPPESIPAFLGAGPLRPVRAQPEDDALLGDLRIWAAATALAPEPVTDETAFALRDRLQLPLSPLGRCAT
ncbi:MAG: hypothetical protein ETSY1_41105 [Candidatus Entotheonella factor]|uniref:Uncharacterized protein n=1 Tax=Entotheonella factor TaxID=1429438 RepID=W4L549_ENTF1|nr:MAG: hypothetical protein ETSY1_41105 [Candidatus Entotheonella factor]